jgi:hypothetical protein
MSYTKGPWTAEKRRKARFVKAAAFDMYEALKAIMEAHGPGTLASEKLYMQAVDALNKAEGRP